MRRQVGNLLLRALLCTVLRRPMPAHETASVLRERGKDRDMKIKWGRAELEDWVRELVSVPERELPRFEAALSVLGILPPDEAAFLLEHRLVRLESEIARQHESLARYRREVPRLFLVEVEYDVAIREAEAAWVRSLLDELTAGSLPGLEQWRAWHATGRMPVEPTGRMPVEPTGRMPVELTGLAERAGTDG